ncbi:hypothetical protein OBV_23880 [Oscillibacter valericigenes Sjm18-20]|nr:hypothetical protein OBV_23880 [Oscillibacter valericigenes Sjm18-20]
MTWDEIKLKTLQLMFSNETAELTEDDSNKEYVNAMPGVCNDALDMVTALIPIRGKFSIVISIDAAEAVEEDGKLTLPVNTEAAYQVELKDYCADFRALDADEIYQDIDGTHQHMTAYSVENESIFVLSGAAAETVTIYYLCYPTMLTSATEGTAELNVPRELAELLPLYMASELYKDDDLSMAVQYRNEFEDALQKLRNSYRKRPTGSGSYQNTTGWW